MTSASPSADALTGRIRISLADARPREVSMFGTIAFMIDDAMAVAVHKDGGLLVRVAPSEDADLLESPGASRAEMGAGRSMGTGWIRVEPAALRSDDVLGGWLDCAIRFLTQRSSAGS